MSNSELLIRQTPQILTEGSVQGDDLYHFELRSPDKRIDLYLLLTNEAFAWTSINRQGPRIPGSTTLLYRRVKDVLQEAADQFERNIRYTLRTRHPKMVAWARTSGEEIFGWDSTQMFGHEIHSRKIFHPQNLRYSDS